MSYTLPIIFTLRRIVANLRRASVQWTNYNVCQQHKRHKKILWKCVTQNYYVNKDIMYKYIVYPSKKQPIITQIVITILAGHQNKEWMSIRHAKWKYEATSKSTFQIQTNFVRLWIIVSRGAKKTHENKINIHTGAIVSFQ